MCALFGASKQAFYKHEDSYFSYLAQESIVVEFVNDFRSEKDPSIGGLKLWYKFQEKSGDSDPIGRDRFLSILSKHNLNLRKSHKNPQTTDSNHNLPKYPNLIKDLLPDRPNQLWVSDITYLKIWHDEAREDYSFCYLSLLTDAYTKEIIGHQVGQSLEAIYTVNTLEMGLERLKHLNYVDLIHHSDRGVQYACFDYTEKLRKTEVKISMTESGNPKDNAVAERVNGTIKNELLKGKYFYSIEEISIAVARAIDFYNNERPHLSLDMMTPAQAAMKSGIIKKRWHSYREKYLRTAKSEY